MSWKDGDFSKELAEVDIQQAVGTTIVCLDGITRRVIEIVNSMRWPWMAIINEQDPESKMGHWVNLLSLSMQILGKGVPDKDAQEAFKRIMMITYKINEDGSFDKPPRKSGIILARSSIH